LPRPTNGRDHLRNRRNARDARRVLATQQTALARALSAQVAGLSLQTTEAGQRQADGGLLNLVALVTQKEVTAFGRMIADFQRRARGLDLALKLTGPWPPYSYDANLNMPTEGVTYAN